MPPPWVAYRNERDSTTPAAVETSLDTRNDIHGTAFTPAGVIGGRPATVAELRDHYASLVAGSSDPDELWLNWIVRRRSDTRPIASVHATVTNRHGRSTANLAWVIGVDWQNHGFASKATRALVGWLREGEQVWRAR